jgi:voltage-gated potassium channel
MKALVSVIASIMGDRASRANLRALLNLLLILLGLVTVFSVLFHVIMLREGRTHSWMTGFYWTCTVMTTLGFGDITFTSDLGRMFSVAVLVTGVIFLLVLLPFTFIEFFYAPWMRAQAMAKAPRELPKGTQNHVLLTCYDAVASSLIPMLEKYGHSYVVLCPTVSEALDLDERGIRAAVGELDDPETYRKMRIERAAMLVTTRGDMVNASVTFTARELAPQLPIVASAQTQSSRDVLELAGATHVLRLEEIMGNTLARRVSIRDSDAHVIGKLDDLLIAEAAAAGTSLVGETLASSQIRARTGISVIGTWNRGALQPAEAQQAITKETVLFVAGTRAQLDKFNSSFTSLATEKPSVLIVGGGKVGRATYRALRELDICTTRIIEKSPERVQSIPEAIVGDATEMEVLKRADARSASTLIITTHDDDTNVALTIFFRRLRSNWQILTRSTLDRNVSTLLRAGADLVLSYASMGANTILNVLRGSDCLLLAEGVNIFPVSIPATMAGQKLCDLDLRSLTGCTVIAVEEHDRRVVNPPAEYRLPDSGRMFLIGTMSAEEQFLRAFTPTMGLGRKRRK